MKIFSYLSENIKIENSTFVLGGFEAIHAGHVELIKKAQSFGGSPVVVCIFRNPMLLPKNKDGNLLQLDIRLWFLAQLKVDYVIIMDFDDWLKHLSAQNFIDPLVQKGAKRFVIGKDYRFGALGQWGANELRKYFANTEIIDLVQENKIKISTSLIKDGLLFGELDYVNSQLAYNYSIKFEFFGEQKSTLWPVNTARLAKGIYFVNFLFNNREYHGLIHLNFANQITFQIIDNDYEFVAVSEIIVEFLYKDRIIISQEKDKIEPQDLINCKSFFEKKLNIV